MLRGEEKRERERDYFLLLPCDKGSELLSSLLLFCCCCCFCVVDAVVVVDVDVVVVDVDVVDVVGSFAFVILM